ncbi:hypothetical protein [Paractinoplanes maris]|uniref:hypothetical protein n=1 Tax=Paractinoplanes maris TaxID=1734446 RepID=UPI00202166E0|nr:hypothetical protein [Actinoplanes maris]
MKRLLTMVALGQSDPPFGPTEISTTLQRPFAVDVKVFECRRCKGIKRARMAPECLGIDGEHELSPVRMKTADSRTAGADTPRLKIR